MGISTHYYTVYGVKHEWNDAFIEAHEEVYDDEDTPIIITDSMSGEYMIFGKVLYDSGDQRWGEIEDVFVEIDVDGLKDVETKYKEEFSAKFPDFANLVDRQFKLMTFVHYS